jgi:hypothetical protein
VCGAAEQVRGASRLIVEQLSEEHVAPWANSLDGP